MRIYIVKWERVLYYGALLTILGLIVFTSANNSRSSIPVYQNEFQSYFEADRPIEGSLEEIYQDIFLTLLDPYLSEAITSYYIEHTGYSPNIDPWAHKILYVKRPNGYRTFLFEIKLEVMPYLGAHNSIGVDHITLRISNEVEIIGFKHIRDYPIPPWLKH